MQVCIVNVKVPPPHNDGDDLTDSIGVVTVAKCRGCTDKLKVREQQKMYAKIQNRPQLLPNFFHSHINRLGSKIAIEEHPLIARWFPMLHPTDRL